MLVPNAGCNEDQDAKAQQSTGSLIAKPKILWLKFLVFSYWPCLAELRDVCTLVAFTLFQVSLFFLFSAKPTRTLA
jgi:hypothetical protein